MTNTYMNYRCILMVAITLIAFQINAQVSRALKLIEKGEYEGVEVMLRAGLADEQERVPAYYGLAQIYSDPAYAGYQLDSAYRYAEAAQAAYKALDYQDRGKVSKDVSSSQIGRRRTDILKAALEKARLDVQRCTIRAPFNAVIKTKYADVGARVSPTAPLGLPPSWPPRAWTPPAHRRPDGASQAPRAAHPRRAS